MTRRSVLPGSVSENNQVRLRARGNRRRGSEALEAALLLPLIIGLVFGIVQFGWYFHVQHTIQGAARFVDAHTHFLHIGIKKGRPALNDCRSKTEALEVVARWLREHGQELRVYAPLIAGKRDGRREENGHAGLRRPTL